MFNSLIYKISSSKYLRNFFMFAVVLLLCACNEKDGQGAMGGDKNFETQASCWQTKIIDAVLKVINNLYAMGRDSVISSGSSLAGGASVVALGFSIWMAFKLLKTLSSFKEENLGEVWTEIGQKLFLCGFCMFILYKPENINWAISTFILPIYTTILELGIRIVQTSSSASTQNLGLFGVITYLMNYSTCTLGEITIDSGLKESILPAANCLVCAISDKLNSGILVGVQLICTLRLSGILVGLTVMFIFTAAKFAFVLFLVDSLFRLNFAVYLLPIFIIGIPFNYTRKWSKHCFLMFINSSGVMLFLGLLVTISVSALEIIVGTIGSSFDEANVEGFGPMLLSVLFISFLIVNIPGMGVALADKFIGGGGSDEFQKKVSKFVMMAAKKAAAATLGALTDGSTSPVTTTLERYEAYREVVDTAKKVQSSVSSKMNELAGGGDE